MVVIWTIYRLGSPSLITAHHLVDVNVTVNFLQIPDELHSKLKIELLQ